MQVLLKDWDDFSKQKLVWTPVNSEYRFTILPPDTYFNNSLFMITGEQIKYLCALFNSKLFIFYLNILLAGESYAYGSGNTFSNINVKKISNTSNNEIVKLVDIVLNKEHSLKDIDNINQWIYETYSLSTEEILYIESLS